MGKSVDAVDLSSCLWAFTALGGHLILPSQLLQYILPKYGGGHWLTTFGNIFCKTVPAWLEYAWQYFEYPPLSRASLVSRCFCETSMPQTEMCYHHHREKHQMRRPLRTILMTTRIIWHKLIIAMMAGDWHLSFWPVVRSSHRHWGHWERSWWPQASWSHRQFFYKTGQRSSDMRPHYRIISLRWMKTWQNLKTYSSISMAWQRLVIF